MYVSVCICDSVCHVCACVCLLGEGGGVGGGGPGVGDYTVTTRMIIHYKTGSDEKHTKVSITVKGSCLVIAYNRPVDVCNPSSGWRYFVLLPTVMYEEQLAL